MYHTRLQALFITDSLYSNVPGEIVRKLLRFKIIKMIN